MILKRIRLGLAVFFGCLLTLLFLDFTGTLRHWFGWMPKLQLFPAILAVNLLVLLGLLLLTLFMGRIYCSVICPLGVLQDGIGRVSGWFQRRKFKYAKNRPILRYGFLLVFVLCIFLGMVSVVQILDPYSSFGRIVSTLFSFPYQSAHNLLALLSANAGNYWFVRHEIWIPSVGAILLSLATIGVILAFSWSNGRMFCNTVCPVGTLLGLVSRFSILRPIIDSDQCNRCGKCERNCKASCIHSKQGAIDFSRCVSCMNCLDVCDKNAIRYQSRLFRKTESTESDASQKTVESAPMSSARRAFLSLAGSFFLSNALFAVDKNPDGGLAEIEDKTASKRTTPITPPGARSLKHFAHHCTACGLCVVNCPNQVLRPASNGSSWLMPVMSFERGYCRPECTNCGDVCPTSAISPVSKEEKASTKIGSAVWLRDQCIVVTDGEQCGNCARHCPTGAIQMVQDRHNRKTRGLIPAIDTELCIGCGSCEHLCPVRPVSAIYVEGVERHSLI